MATVPASFQALLARLQPLESERLAAVKHMASIKSRLASAYNLKKFFPAGSYVIETSIRGMQRCGRVCSFVARDDVRWGGAYMTSTTVLNNFKSELENRFYGSSVCGDDSMWL